MKKVSFAMLVLFIIACIVPAFTIAAPKFSDVPAKAFYKEDLNFIANDPRHILEGYKGRFNPEGALSVAQFIKIAVALENEPVPAAKKEEKWYIPYINKAKEKGYVLESELGNCERDITRGEIARITVRFLEKSGEKLVYRDPEQIKFLIKDYSQLASGLRDYIVKAYDLGLIGGYSDGTFGPDDKFTRAQAVVVVRRLLDSSKRLKFDINEYIKKFTKVYNGVSFNSYTDVKGFYNVMKLDKAQEFAARFYTGLVFYHKDGKNYVKGNIPKIPPGFDFFVKMDFNTGEDVYTYSTNSSKKSYAINTQGFDIKLNSSLSKEKIKKITVTVAIYTTEGQMDKYSDGSFKMSYPDKKLSKIGSNKISVKLPFPASAFKQW